MAEEFYSEQMLKQHHETAANCVELCLDAAAHIDANANQATLIEWWLDEVGQVSNLPRTRAG
jgi:hypothetical protein